MKKIEYESPQVEAFNVRLETSILSNVERMRKVAGDWDDFDEE